MRDRVLIPLAACFVLAAVTAAPAQTSTRTVAPHPVLIDADPVAQTPPTPPVAPTPTTPAVPRAMRPGEAPAPPAAPGVPGGFERRTRSQLVNVKIELTITDQVGTKPPEKKNISMIVADGERGGIRTNAEVQRRIETITAGQTNVSSTFQTVPLSVDAWPEIDGTKIRLRLSLEYDLIAEAGTSLSGKTSIRETLAVIADNGVPLTVSLSADPMTDRKVALDVKATILK
jgi:hypothetical protein